VKTVWSSALDSGVSAEVRNFSASKSVDNTAGEYRISPLSMHLLLLITRDNLS
jgi:hypothetical protein